MPLCLEPEATVLRSPIESEVICGRMAYAIIGGLVVAVSLARHQAGTDGNWMARPTQSSIDSKMLRAHGGEG